MFTTLKYDLGKKKTPQDCETTRFVIPVNDQRI